MRSSYCARGGAWWWLAVAAVAAVLLAAGRGAASQVHPGQCVVLAVEGGGDKGAFEAGAITQLTEQLGPLAAYDVLTGVSVGGITAFALGVYPVEDFAEQNTVNMEVWNKLGQIFGQIMQPWPWGVAQGLLEEQGLYSFHEAEYIRTYETRFPALRRPILIGANNLVTGGYELFNSTQLDFEGFAQAVQASASIPFVFPPTRIGDKFFIDGGSTYNMLPVQGVLQCEAMGFALEQIAVDVLMTHPPQFAVAPLAPHSNIFRILHRLQEIRAFYRTVFEIKHSVWECPRVRWRYLVPPAHELDSSFLPINFDQHFLDGEYHHGLAQAQASLDLGEFGSFQKYLNLEDLDQDSHQTGLGAARGRAAQLRERVVFV